MKFEIGDHADMIYYYGSPYRVEIIDVNKNIYKLKPIGRHWLNTSTWYHKGWLRPLPALELLARVAE